MESLWARLGGGRPGRPGRPHDDARASEAKEGAPDGDARGSGGGGVELALEDSGREKAMAASQVGGIIVQATYQASLEIAHSNCLFASVSLVSFKSLCFRPKTTTRT